ncbi:MAG: hypothetical protein JW776_14210 [Candidatus Lokiarchaeota archaeon]|nr:hypothetical protein [Candidatus Lokiarchaeota archaeon]
MAVKSLRDRLWDTFSHTSINRIVYSPRIYYWYLGNNLLVKKPDKYLKGPVPDRFIGKTQLEIYDMLDASPRYAEETLYLPILSTKIKPEAGIHIRSKRGSKKGETITVYSTPLGVLTETKAIGGGLGAHYIEFPVKSIEDIPIMKYILDNTEFQFNQENFEEAEQLLGSRGIASLYVFSTPYQRLIKTIMGFTRTTVLLKRKPNEMIDFMAYMEEWDDKMYNLVEKSPVRIVNFGENIDANLSPPPIFEKYLLPYYEKRVKQLRNVGIVTHIHIDGSFKQLLPYFEKLPFDGLEALTCDPQGDVTIDELSQYIGDKILLDGVPSILFLPQYSLEYVENYTRKVLETFSPNLILGVSDELSPNGDITKLERIRDIVNNFEP